VRRALPVAVPKAPGSGNQTSVPSPLYTVTDGDTLTGIARRYNTTVDYLRQLNNLSDTNIRVGQKLRLRPEAPGLDGAGGGPTAGTTGTGGSSPRHVVRSGDTLSSLARQYGVKLSQLREWNELESDTIRVGQKLRVGQGRAVAEPGPANRREVARNDGAAEVHVVQSGETLFSISRQYAVSVPDLRVANELRSDSIFAGQKLRIPGDDFDPAEALATRQSDGGAVGTGTLGGVDAAEDDGWISPTSRPMQEPVTDQQTSTGAPAAWEQPGHYLDLVNPGDAGATAQAHLSEANQTARPAPTGAGTGTYMVQPNDTLWGISRKFDVSLERLRAINDLRGDTIRPGKTLRIP
jgi:LysM repeat protein